jgi:hypothetical protein
VQAEYAPLPSGTRRYGVKPVVEKLTNKEHLADVPYSPDGEEPL